MIFEDNARFNNCTTKSKFLSQTPTIKKIAQILLSVNTYFKEVFTTQSYLLLNEKRDKKIFAFPPATGTTIAFKHLAGYIKTYSIYSFDFLEDDDRISKYVDLITGIQKEGQYIFMGHSAGGNLAFEVAKEMEKRGYYVSAIIMVDSYRKNESMNEHNITKDDIEALMLSFLQGYEEYKDEETDIKLVVDKVFYKTQKYYEYICKLNNVGKVKADIYLLRSDETIIKESDKDWDMATTGKYIVYEGIGPHEKMLAASTYVKYNADVLSHILKNIG